MKLKERVRVKTARPDGQSLSEIVTDVKAHERRWWLVQSAFGQSVLIKAEVVAEFVQKCGADFFAEKLFVTFSRIPNIFQKENDLRRQRRVFLIRKFRPGEKAQRVRFDAVGL